jgi:DNA polymerase III alpha subunit
MNQTLSNKYTELHDRVLWFDGDCSMTKDQIERYFLNGNFNLDKVHIEEIDEEVIKFNKLTGNHLGIKNYSNNTPIEWNIPEQYNKIDVFSYMAPLVKKYVTKNPQYDKNDIVQRVVTELESFAKLNMLGMIKVIIYLIDTLKKENLVWGVGRGSSCASFVLFLLELHKVDCIKYDVPLEEFFREELNSSTNEENHEQNY